MKPLVLAIAALCCNESVQAYSNFLSNPDSPYPPGCAADPYRLLESENAKKFYEGNLSLVDARTPIEAREAKVAAYRVQCADLDRSQILLTFTDILDPTYPYTLFQAPLVRAVVEGEADHWMNLVREPNTWEVGIEPWDYAQSFGGVDGGWVSYNEEIPFVLEGGKAPGENPWSTPSFSAGDYNGNFELVLTGADNAETVIDVPSGASLFDSATLMPLSGRLSGNWVVDGVADQGFLISVSELVGNSIPDYVSQTAYGPLLMFLSWYAYDANGDLLWLTGAARFEQGATQVTVPIELVTHGQFLGTKPADREVVGSVTITGNNCSDLGFEYELNDIGLGSGTKHLQRLFALEIAGNVCRDMEARIAENAK